MEVIHPHYLGRNYNNLHIHCTYRCNKYVIIPPVQELEYRSHVEKKHHFIKVVHNNDKQEETFLIMGLFVGTIVTLSL